MNITFYKYQGTGNDFIMIDNRDLSFNKTDSELINKLCGRRFGIGADGLILLEPSNISDFKMVYFNADGNEGSMCGNGGRCIVAFAKQLGIIKDKTEFNAVDGLHLATVENDIVSLKMIDVENVNTFKSHCFLNTGSPHHIEFNNNVNEIEIVSKGKEIRYGSPYFKEGTNVNFAEQLNENLFKVRTYERGVENETLACGTGVTAVAIAAHKSKLSTSNTIKIKVLGGELQVRFSEKDGSYSNVYLIGPAKFVFKGEFTLND